MCRFYFVLPGNDCTKDEKTAEEVGRRRRPTSCAVLGLCCFGFLYNHFLRAQHIIYTYWVYLMEHIYFEAQLCINVVQPSLSPSPPHKSQDPYSGRFSRSLLQGLLRSSRLAREPNYLLRTGGPVIYFKAPDPGCNLYPGNFGPSRGSDLRLPDFASKVQLQKYPRAKHFI